MRRTLRDAALSAAGFASFLLPLAVLTKVFGQISRARYGRISRFFMLFVAIWFSVLPTVQVLAAPGDLSAVQIAAGTNPGEFAFIEDGPNGFQIVSFFYIGDDPATATPISGPFESSTLNAGSTSSGGSTNPDYVGDAVDQTVEAAIPGAKDGNVIGDGGIFIPPIPSVVQPPNPGADPVPFPGRGDPVPGGNNPPGPGDNPDPVPPVGDPVNPPLDNEACKKCKAKLAALLAQKGPLEAQIAALEARIANIANDPNIPPVEDIAEEIAANEQTKNIEHELIAQIDTARKNIAALNDLSAAASSESNQGSTRLENLELSTDIIAGGIFIGGVGAIPTTIGFATIMLSGAGTAALVATVAVIATVGGAVVMFGGILLFTGAIIAGVIVDRNALSSEERVRRIKAAIKAKVSSLKSDIAAKAAQLAGIQDARLERARIEAEKNRVQLIAELEAKLKKQLDAAEAQLQLLKNAILQQTNRCKAICALAGGQARLGTRQVVAVAASPATTTRTNFNAKSSRQSTIPVTLKGNRLVGKFDLRQLRQQMKIEAAAATGQRFDGRPLVDLPGIFGDERFNIWLSPSVTIQNNTRSGPNQDGTTVAISGGASWLVQQGLNIGLIARYANTNLKGSGANTKSDTWSAGAFIQALVFEQVNLKIAGVFSRSDIDSRFTTAGVTARGNANADAFSSQATLSRSFKMGEFTFTPALNASYVHINRKAFTLSDGTFVPGGISDQITFSGGPTISRTFALPESEIEITPGFGVNFFVNASRAKSFLDVDFARRKSGNYGISLSGSLGFKAPGGISWSVNGGFSGIEGGQRSYTLGGNLTIPLN